jgi:hypothetical protein
MMTLFGWFAQDDGIGGFGMTTVCAQNDDKSGGLRRMTQWCAQDDTETGSA